MAIPDKGISVQEPLILPDPHRLDRIPSFPLWVDSLNSLIKNEEQRSTKDGKYRTIPTLPANAMLSAEQRAILEIFVANIAKLCAQTPQADVEYERTTFVILTDFMMSFLSLKQQSEEVIEALGKAFMFALKDIPWWAVLRAVELWRLGEAGLDEQGKAYNYPLVPATAGLRRIAKVQTCAVHYLASVPRKLLTAEPRVEYSEEHRVRMSERFAALRLSLK